jgi:peptidyl-prolyl cis-trans isomerase A (cyclophilin A)
MTRISAWCSLLLVWTTALVHANPLAQFHTVFGTIEVELLQSQRPETVANFIRYIESGRYHGTFIHRLQPNFLVAGGGFLGANRGTPDATYAAVDAFKPITNETRRGGIITNFIGTLALGTVSNESTNPIG